MQLDVRPVMRVLDSFFDRPKVMAAVSEAKRRFFMRGGGLIRTIARRSMRRRKGTSEPGQPPFAHDGSLRDFLFFSYDQSAGTVVVGPAATNQVFFNNDRKPVRGTVPSVLEFGGEITILEAQYGDQWHRADLRSKRRLAGRALRYRRAKIAARPYMAPALDLAADRLPDLWKNSVVKGAA